MTPPPGLPDEPELLKSLRTDAEKEAYKDGWMAAAAGAPRHQRPNYLTHAEREAFNAGWDIKAYIGLL
jgi:hypothetical protein